MKNQNLTKHSFPLKMTLKQRRILEDYAWANRLSQSEVLRRLIESLED